MKINKLHLIIAAISLPIVLFAQQNGIAPKDATQATIEANKKVYSQLNFNDKQDYEDVNRGLIVPLAGLSYKNSTGQTMWDLNEYSFLNKQEAPNTINPSLYRISQLNMPAGLFKVTDHIYQVRGLDLANMTIIEGKTGIIVIDPLGSGDAGKTAINMYYDKFGKKKILAVIFTHSHGDHYGGVKGVIDEADVKSGKVQLIAPEGFLQEAISENVYAGNAMLRRGTYMYGMLLPRSEKGQVDGGLGKGTSPGFVGIMEPNVMIKKTGEKMTIDGVDIVFQMAPGTEAPSEMLFYFPQFKALCSAEDCTHTLHNLYTLRGAQVRDAKQWWKILDETNNMFGKDVEVMFGSHHWPTWGNQRVVNMLKSQRDLYKFLHDRTLNLINQGYTMLEVGEMVKLPKSLDQQFANRGYYGSVNHDAKAIYQRYLGFYSSNPADLYQLVPEEAAKKYVEYMGGISAIITKAREDFNKGNYRWVAQVMNQVVFAEPQNKEARELTADALEQLGYQTENATWRNEYLTGALELRNGIPNLPIPNLMSMETLKGLTWDMLFDYMGIRLNTDKAEGKSYSFNINIEGTSEKYLLTLENSVLIYTKGKQAEDADATIILTDKTPICEMLVGQSTLDDLVKNGKIKFSGSQEKLNDVFAMQDNFKTLFNIVTP